MLGHKTSLKFKRTELIQKMFFNHSVSKLEINDKKKISEIQTCLKIKQDTCK